MDIDFIIYLVFCNIYFITSFIILVIDVKKAKKEGRKINIGIILAFILGIVFIAIALIIIVVGIIILTVGFKAM